MKKVRNAVLAVCAVCLCAVPVFALRGLLEKPLFFVNANGKIEKQGYWMINLGKYDVTLNRKFAGEEMKAIETSIDLFMTSSGYIQASGYSEKGKIECSALMMVKTPSGDRKIEVGEIDCLTDNGTKVKLTDSTTGDLVLDIEKNQMLIKKMQVRVYKFQADEYGENVLKEQTSNTDIPITAWAFSAASLKTALNLPANTTVIDTDPPAKKGKK